ncbi:MAG: hypothetical protein D6791_16350, partial [Chloroflexi bacterium]
MTENLVVRTRLIRPRLKPQYVRRPRVEERLRQSLALPVTVVKADAGHGKSTAVADCLSYLTWPAFWYSLAESDADPLVFLAHIIHAFRSAYPTCGDRALALLQQPGGATEHGLAVVDALVNDLLEHLAGDAVLVLDDYHLVEGREINPLVERFIEHAPPTLHLVLITRHTPNLRGRVRWRAYGEWAEITTTDLTFTPEEVQLLFATHGSPLTLEQARILAAETEGWVIALQMILQHVQATAPGQLEVLLERLPGPLSGLFTYLATEVLDRQPPDIQQFLLHTAILSRLDADVCACLLDDPQAGDKLRMLDDRSLFVVDQGEGCYRYHHLFQDFLHHQARLRLGSLEPLHRRAAAFYRQREDLEAAIPHLLAAGDFSEVAEFLANVARRMVYQGRYVTLAAWVDRLPNALLDEYPELLQRRGDAARLTSRFDEALSWYRRARRQAVSQADWFAEVRALRGEAMVYLDTVQPALAAPLLQEALRRVRHENLRERIRLLLLLAENLANQGHLRQAERLYRAVQGRCPTYDFPDIEPRIRVRAGQLAEARTLTEQLLTTSPWGTGRQRMPRSHREATVLLSWICALTGEHEAARRYAEQGLRLGQELHSPIVECVALARLGHARLAGPNYDPRRAGEYYRQSLALAETMQVPRFGVEAHLGLTLVEGLSSHLWTARRHARQGLEILDMAGDIYLSAVVWLALGTAGVLCGDPHAEEWLGEAIQRGEQCGDRYAPCLARLWLAWMALCHKDRATCLTALAAALNTMQAEGYDFMLTAIPFLGLKAAAQRIELLQIAVTAGIATDYAATLLQQALQETPSAGGAPFGPWMAPPMGEHGPPPLYVQTLGPFRVWRGLREISASAWARDKALRLFQFLLTQRHRAVHREEIWEALWPGKDPQAAATGLRVALNALHQALEPARPPGTSPFYVQRAGETLRFNPEASIQLDSEVFEQLVKQAREMNLVDPAEALNLYRRALALYQGDFLETCRYDDWAIM